jgi:hypothetical protein
MNKDYEIESEMGKVESGFAIGVPLSLLRAKRPPHIRGMADHRPDLIQ